MENKSDVILKNKGVSHLQSHLIASYYRYYTGRKWGNAGNYDLCLNSSAYGVEGTVDLILQILGK